MSKLFLSGSRQAVGVHHTQVGLGTVMVRVAGIHQDPQAHMGVETMETMEIISWPHPQATILDLEATISTTHRMP